MKKTWNQFYKQRGRFYLQPHPSIDKIINKFMDYRVKRVLDLGCGSGRHCIRLAKSDFKMIGMDFSKESLKLAKRWAKKEKLKIKFITGDIHKKIPFNRKLFDGILAIDSLHYDTIEALEFTLNESKRVLKNKGIIFITLPTQICNPLMTHLIFSKEEIVNLVSKHFKIIDKFLDKRNFLCVFGLHKN